MRHDYGVDIFGTIAEKLSSLSSFTAMAKELVQNADDEESEYMQFNFCDNGLYVTNASVFDDEDFERITNIASRGKEIESHKTGAFGIGFVSVYQITDRPEVQSAGKKYVFLLEEKAADESHSEINDYTEFFLPWAFDSKSIIRTKLKRVEISKDDINKFMEELAFAAPGILLFLRILRRLEVSKNGLTIMEFIRDDDNPPVRKVTQIKHGKSTVVREWLTYESSFDTPEAAELNKENVVGIAFPTSQGNTTEDGVLYDFLPTGMYTDFKFHINGDFFPTSDRQRIIHDGDTKKVNWNQKVIFAIGKLLVKCILDMKQLLPASELYSYFPAYDYNNKNLPMLDTICRIFYESAIKEDIVQDELFKWYKPEQIYLVESKDDIERRTLVDIGIPIVNSSLRTNWQLLQAGLRVRNLDLNTLVTYIQGKGIEAGTSQTDVPMPFNTTDGLCNILLFVNDRIKISSEEKFLSSFNQLPICPDDNGRLYKFTDLKLSTPSILRIFKSSDELPLVNSILQKQCKETLLRLTREYDWRDIVDLLSAKTPEEIARMDKDHSPDLLALYDYLADCQQQILEDSIYQDKLKNACIFLTNRQFKPLSGLCLRGNYDDPIGLDIIICEELLDDKAKGFLKKLGVEQLTFPKYVTKYAPDYFDNSTLWQVDDRRLELTEEIRKNFSLIDNNEIRSLLKTFRMIPCNDGQFHTVKDIYLKSELLDAVLGGKYLHPDEQRIGRNLTSWIEWLKLLGVNDKPKPSDIIRRIQELSAKWSQKNIQAIEQLFYYLCDIFEQENFVNEELYNNLKYMEWLPSENDNEYHLPSEVFLPYSKHLFYSQAQFVPFKQRAKMRGRFLTFIEIGNYPTPALIIQHLLWLSKHGIEPNYDIYRALNDKYAEIQDETITYLGNTNCVYVEGSGYCKAKACYWSNHPFGHYRYKASDQLRNYHNILKRIGIREDPQLEDYLEVLKDISELFGNVNKVLDPDTQAIVETIYTFLALRVNEIPDEWLHELSKGKVVLDRSGLLRPPNYIFFEDKGITVDIFKERLKSEMIDKESGTWQFLTKLGVRHLSQAIQPAYFKPSSDKEINKDDMDLIQSRRRAIVTIVETQRKDFDIGWNLQFLDYLEVYGATQLVVKYEVKIDGSPIYSDERIEKSFYDESVHRLYIAHNCAGQDRTYEIARNVASILNPQIDPCHVLPVLVEVLKPQELNAVEQYLSHMGYDIVIEPEVLYPSTILGDGRPDSQDESKLDMTEETPTEESSSTSGTGAVPIDKPEDLLPKPEDKLHRKKRHDFDFGEETAAEIEKKRREWLEEKLNQERSTKSFRDSDYTPVNHDMTPEERENHKRFALIFYNRQVEELISRIQEIESNKSPSQFTIYGREWEEISKLIRDRDGNKCRRCGLSEEDGISLVVHHILPRKNGGSNWHSNLITLCRTCHAEVEERPWLL